MDRKRLVFSLGGIILCFSMLTISLMMNGLAHSHAVGPLHSTMQSHTSTGTPSARSFYDVQNNIYFGITFGSIYALNATTGAQLWQYTDSAAIGCDPNGEHSGISILRAVSGIVYVNPCDTDTACPSHLVALRVTDGSQLWCSSFPIPPGWNGSSQFLAISQGIIYLMPGIYCGVPPSCNQILYALNAQDGSLLWSYSPPSSMFGAGFSHFQLVQGVIYLSISGQTPSPAGPPVAVSQVCALNASDGSQRWCVSNAGEIGLAWGVVYATENTSSGSTILAALRASDGSQIWSYRGAFSQVVASTNVVYTGGPTSICALKSSDGSQRWCASINSTYFSFRVQAGVIYVPQYPDYPGNIQAFSTSTGTLLWTKHNADILALGQGVAYLLTSDARVEAIHATDGSVLWSYKPAHSGSAYFSLADQVIYYNTPHGLRALSASTGTLLWSHFTATTVNLSFQSASNGIAYVESNNTTTSSFTLNAFDASNGTLLWKYAIVCVGLYC